ncbi:hypothetical protein [Actinoplanes subtropicus]|uniref:COG4705 family protein n=1 Tax=Actinoplanes subtropicus TaxID=543632 RepID=UPI0007C4CE6F|nr:hypothetical protein [Actinoplanes subtropicus]
MTSGWQDDLQRPFRRYLSTVPEVTVLFWLIKVLVTPVGDGTVDYLTGLLGLGITTMLVATPLAVLLVAQLAIGRYVPWLYWLIVLLIGVFGILINDNLTDIFDVPATTAALAFAVLLAAVLATWYATERTLSIHTIDTPRREAYYWLAVLFTFALGAAASDAGGESFGLGYGGAATVLAVAIAAVWATHRFLKVNGALAFWIGYVLTFPLGATVADLVARPAATTAAALVTMVGAVTYLTVSHRDEPSLTAEASRFPSRWR